jgi:hypothetical protein
LKCFTNVAPLQPLDLVDFLLDLQALEIIKLGLVTLKLCEEPVLGIIALFFG